MNQQQLDIDGLSDRELTDLTTKVCRRILSRGHLVHPLAIRGDDQRPIGFLVSLPIADNNADKESELLTKAKRRLENPPARYLSVDEFLASLDDDSSKSIPA
jgi:hypothetical protein